MNLSNVTVRRAKWLRRLGLSMLVAALAVGPVAPARADQLSLAGAPSESRVTAFALHWFTEMQAGRTDRALYAAGFVAQVTDEAIRKMSHDLNVYGASPLGAVIVQTRRNGGQIFYIVKFVFSRGDGTSLLFGFDAEGKITGIAVGGMAGD